MPANLIIILSIVIGLLLIRIVMARIGRRRKSRRLEREIAEHLVLKEQRQKNN
jgi:uncharacterized integral membrane protein